MGDPLTDDQRALCERYLAEYGLKSALRIFDSLWRLLRAVGYDRDDACSIACLGLVRAAQTYVPERGKFSSWAGHHVRGALKRVVADESRQKRDRRNEVYCGPVERFATKDSETEHEERVRNAERAMGKLRMLPQFQDDFVHEIGMAQLLRLKRSAKKLSDGR